MEIAAELTKLFGSDGLVVFTAAMLAETSLSERDAQLLCTVGLPANGEPYLNFQAPKSGGLRSLNEIYDLDQTFVRYRPIGFDLNGNPICLDEQRGGGVVIMDHETWTEQCLLNSSVSQLAECLVLYQHLAQRVVAEQGQAAWDNEEAVSEAAIHWFETELRKSDEPAMVAESSFWMAELFELAEQ